MILRALSDVWVRFVWKAEGGVTYEVAPFSWILGEAPLSQTSETIHLQAGDGVYFTRPSAGENPYQMIADHHPDLFVIESAKRRMVSM